MEYVVDRLEEGLAVCEMSGGETVCFPLDMLPPDTKEGSVLHEEAGVFTLDDAATEARRSALFALQQGLFDETDDA